MIGKKKFKLIDYDLLASSPFVQGSQLRGSTSTMPQRWLWTRWISSRALHRAYVLLIILQLCVLYIHKHIYSLRYGFSGRWLSTRRAEFPSSGKLMVVLLVRQTPNSFEDTSATNYIIKIKIIIIYIYLIDFWSSKLRSIFPAVNLQNCQDPPI